MSVVGRRFCAGPFFFLRQMPENPFTYLIFASELNFNFKHNKTMAYVITDDCIACGTCIDECPVGAISEGDIYKIDPEVCTECGSCADVCPSEAITQG
jgi:ferredoxin